MKKALQGLIFFVFLFSVNVLQADENLEKKPEEKTEKTIKITINSAELTEYLKGAGRRIGIGRAAPGSCRTRGAGGDPNREMMRAP